MLKNGEGGYVADADTLDRLEGEGRVVARYLDGNPNGSLRDIAGITNERGNVVGLMPHPEHAVEALTGAGTDGLGLLHQSLAAALGMSAAQPLRPLDSSRRCSALVRTTGGAQRTPFQSLRQVLGAGDAGDRQADLLLPGAQRARRWRRRRRRSR